METLDHVPVRPIAHQVLAVTGGGEGSVALWRVGEDGLVAAADPQPGHGASFVRGDGPVKLWRVGKDRLARAGLPRYIRSDTAWTVAVGQLGDQQMAVAGGQNGTLALWRVGER